VPSRHRPTVESESVKLWKDPELPLTSALEPTVLHNQVDTDLVAGIRSFEKGHLLLADRAIHCRLQLVGHRGLIRLSQLLDDALPAIVVTKPKRITHCPHPFRNCQGERNRQR
jgi:hypothetical protein